MTEVKPPISHPAMDDWTYDNGSDRYINKWTEGLSISRADFMRLPLEVRTGGAKAINDCLNQIAIRRIEHSKKIKAGKARAAALRGE